MNEETHREGERTNSEPVGSQRGEVVNDGSRLPEEQRGEAARAFARGFLQRIQLHEAANQPASWLRDCWFGALAPVWSALVAALLPAQLIDVALAAVHRLGWVAVARAAKRCLDTAEEAPTLGAVLLVKTSPEDGRQVFALADLVHAVGYFAAAPSAWANVDAAECLGEALAEVALSQVASFERRGPAAIVSRALVLVLLCDLSEDVHALEPAERGALAAAPGVVSALERVTGKARDDVGAVARFLLALGAVGDMAERQTPPDLVPVFGRVWGAGASEDAFPWDDATATKGGA